MRFDGPEIAHGWLAVAAASGTDAKLPTLFRTVVIEEYDDEHHAGVVLYATDRFMMIKAWVPEVDGCAAPALDESPTRTVIARDTDKRAASLLGYVCSLANREGEDYIHGQIELRMEFDQRLPAGSDPQSSLDGMEPTYVVLTVPDVERVYLEVVEAEPPEWRGVIEPHVAEATDTISLAPELLERLAKVRKHASGRLFWTFAGDNRAARFDFTGSDPHICGVLMPARDPDIDDDDDADDDPDDNRARETFMQALHDGTVTVGRPGPDGTFEAIV